MEVHDQQIKENPLTEPEPNIERSTIPKVLQRKRLREYEEDPNGKTRKIQEGILLASKKPSYCLKQGIGSLQRGGESLRSQHRKRLWKLLNKLLQCHNWVEASGVMNVLLQGTVKDRSITRNRSKYWAALELLHHINGENISSKRIQKGVQNIYDLWMKKIGPLKNWSPKSRFRVQTEFIIFCLQHGSTQDAYQAALLLMQERGFDIDPVSNLVVGLVFYQRWYSGIPEDLQLKELDSCEPLMHLELEIPINGLNMSFGNSKENDVNEAGSHSPVQIDSNTSIANDKKVIGDDNSVKKEPMSIDDSLRKETSHPDMHYDEGSVHSDYSFPNYVDDLPRSSIFLSQGLPRWLLPLKLPNSYENVEDAVYTYRKLQNDNYKNALKHLRVALYSTPPLIEALHPLIQLLLLGDQVHEALVELQNLFHSSDTVLQLRLKAGLLEHFDGGNYVKLSTCFENVLKKDPTCSDSLAKLVVMHRHGEYDDQNLAEMIALHLDATQGTRDTWEELASCFLKLSQCEEDRVSTCCNGYTPEKLNNSNKIPEIFTNNSESGKAWRFRCRWWLNRHFSNKILVSDIASADLELLTYKASTASHLYGRHFKYVVKSTECLEKENNMELYSFLLMHILNSVGFYSMKRNNTS